MEKIKLIVDVLFVYQKNVYREEWTEEYCQEIDMWLEDMRVNQKFLGMCDDNYENLSKEMLINDILKSDEAKYLPLVLK